MFEPLYQVPEGFRGERGANVTVRLFLNFEKGGSGKVFSGYKFGIEIGVTTKVSEGSFSGGFSFRAFLVPRGRFWRSEAFFRRARRREKVIDEEKNR